MRKIFHLFILSMLFLTQCEILKDPAFRNPQNTPGNTPGQSTGDSGIGLPDLGGTPKVEKENEFVSSGQYPRFVVNSFNKASDYMDIAKQPTPPELEDIHANTALSTFRQVANRHSNAMISPFLLSCDDNGQATTQTIAQVTNDRLSVSSELQLEIDKAVYFSANWKQKQQPQLSNIMFQGTPITAIKISGKCYSHENDELQLIYLPLEIKDFSVYLFVPKTTLAQLLANMQFPQMNEAVQKLKKRNCEIELPAFRMYFNLPINVNKNAISMLQIDQQGCEFSAVHTKLSAPDNTMIEAFDAGTNVDYEDEELDLAKIKSPYLKNKSNESINITIDKPFFIVLRHLKTGEFLSATAVNNLQEKSTWGSTIQHLTPEESLSKTPTLNRFGWGYTRRVRPQDLLPDNDNSSSPGNQ
ncbi:serpin family protein [Candidatus Uabimicrobium amorphum]|uniref:Serine protease inhibitor n=1 Tax=Uabimicrobium amorphum TaxID=2596890 RepID=A0A5S9F522_UABAM|nr:serpin family protein [Candidatus Uabimicrobium amorphum]BBM84822.1 serine protease inhibitor [Candidatus Uabimicrobium amorphum]